MYQNNGFNVFGNIVGAIGCTFIFKNLFGSGEIRTRASEETGALNQRLRPLGHATLLNVRQFKIIFEVQI